MGRPVVARATPLSHGSQPQVILCVHFGLMEEAHEWLGRLLQIVPGLTIAGYKSQFAPINPPEILVRYVEGLRNAGLLDECLLPV